MTTAPETRSLAVAVEIARGRERVVGDDNVVVDEQHVEQEDAMHGVQPSDGDGVGDRQQQPCREAVSGRVDGAFRAIRHGNLRSQGGDEQGI